MRKADSLMHASRGDWNVLVSAPDDGEARMANDVLDAMVRGIEDRAASDIASLEALRGIGHEEILAKAVDVMGDGAAHWLTRHAMALDAVPAELLAEGGEEGRRLVDEALARIEHGVYA